MSVTIPPGDSTKDYRFTIELLREIYKPFALSEYANLEIDRLLDVYSTLPGPYLATRRATLSIFVELQRAFDELRDIIGEEGDCDV